eukprot:CAMPEP_0201573392 /NCGR_PEP_ID=MMETSP0190_2-20130828/17233_1 /ASSEMBLY_ACC=CAM_ASM_000263 /TAXON_ID=37353 /ORGANISM="Rosalina sp." /LENGTH=236 /DNA_ID=CAMNT_0048000325 /DNA_START=32 /DNA_END=742 /DNA_ORIENTATION=+
MSTDDGWTEVKPKKSDKQIAVDAAKKALKEGTQGTWTYIGTTTTSGKSYDGIVKYSFQNGGHTWKLMFHFKKTKTAGKGTHSSSYDHLICDDSDINYHSDSSLGVTIKSLPSGLQSKIDAASAHIMAYNEYDQDEYDAYESFEGASMSGIMPPRYHDHQYHDYNTGYLGVENTNNMDPALVVISALGIFMALCLFMCIACIAGGVIGGFIHKYVNGNNKVGARLKRNYEQIEVDQV